MRLFVTGATGYIGQHLIARLACSYQIVCLVRPNEPAGNIKHLSGQNLTVVEGDILWPLPRISGAQDVDARRSRNPDAAVSSSSHDLSPCAGCGRCDQVRTMICGVEFDGSRAQQELLGGRSYRPIKTAITDFFGALRLPEETRNAQR